LFSVVSRILYKMWRLVQLMLRSSYNNSV